MKIRHREDPSKLRRAEYPDLADFADAYYWQQRGQPEKMEEWLARCDAVKAKYPKDR